MYNFKQIQTANLSIKTTNVQGKDYAEVNQRIKAFRSICPCGSIVTEMISLANGVCIFKASVHDEDGKILGTGTAYEKEGSSSINKTSYIENCETSAVGRALGMCGFGIDTSVCSAEELQNAILNQEQEQPKTYGKQIHPRDALVARLCELGIDVHDYAEKHKLKGETDPEVFRKLLKELNRR